MTLRRVHFLRMSCGSHPAYVKSHQRTKSQFSSPNPFSSFCSAPPPTQTLLLKTSLSQKPCATPQGQGGLLFGRLAEQSPLTSTASRTMLLPSEQLGVQSSRVCRRTSLIFRLTTTFWSCHSQLPMITTYTLIPLQSASASVRVLVFPGFRLFYPPKRKWRLPQQSDPADYAEIRTDGYALRRRNFSLVSELCHKVIGVLEDQTRHGQVIALTEQDARARFHTIASLGQIKMEKTRRGCNC